mgnify:FL=1
MINITLLEKLTAIDISKLQDASTFDKLNYINTLWINIALQVALILIPFLLWFFWGLGSGGTRKMRLQKPNYYFFLVLLLIQILIIIIYDFPIWLLIFE